MFRLVVFLFVLNCALLFSNDNLNIIWSMNVYYQVENVAVSPDSKWILAQDNIENVFIYDADTKEIVFEGKSPAKNLFFSKDGKRVYGSKSSKICYHDVDTWQFHDNFESFSQFNQVFISNDERYIIAAKSGGYIVWDVETGAIVKNVSVPNNHGAQIEVIKPKISKDGKKIYLLSRENYKVFEDLHFYDWYDGRILAFDFKSGTILDTLWSWDAMTQWGLTDYDISKDNEMLVVSSTSGCPGNLFYLQNIEFCKCVSYGFPFMYPSKIEFTTNNQYILLLSFEDKLTYFVLYPPNENDYHSKSAKFNVNCYDLSPDEKFIAAGSGSVLYKLLYNPTLAVDTEIPNPENIFPNPTSGVFNVAFDNPSGANVKAYLCDIIGTGQIPLFDDYMAAGSSTLQFSIGEYPTGNYLLKLYVGEVIRTYKVSLIK